MNRCGTFAKGSADVLHKKGDAYLASSLIFSRLKWGIGAKGSGGRFATEVRCNGSKSTSAVILQGVRCIRKERWGANATWGRNAKVGCKRKDCPQSATATGRWGKNAKERAETRSLRSIIIHFPLNQESLKAIHINAHLSCP